MSDIRIIQAPDKSFDIGISNGDIEGDEGFETAILDSLLEDARAPADKVIKPENRRGWMGNLVSPVKDRQRGSLLWLTNQRRLTQNTLNETIDYARKALNWFVEDGISTGLEVLGTIVPTQGILLEIIITALNGQTENHYIRMWELTANAN
jgi:phage gp46-like protein